MPAAIPPYASIGSTVFLMILPSALPIPRIEQTAIMLFRHTMLPIAPPTDCKASVRLTSRPLLWAIDC